MPAASNECSAPSPSRQLLDLLDDVLLGGIYDRVGPDIERLLLAGLRYLRDHYLTRPHRLQALHGDRPDRAAPEHERALPLPEPCPAHRAQANRDGLDQRALLARKTFGELVDHVRRYDRELGHAAAPAHQTVEPELLAQVGGAPPASRALAAPKHRLDGDPVPRRHPVHVVADLDDLARELVPRHDRVARGLELAVEDVQVGPADPGAGDADDHVERSRDLRRGHVDDPRRLVVFEESRRLHGPSSSALTSARGPIRAGASPLPRAHSAPRGAPGRGWCSTPC